jgi:hypothetical protein
MNGRRRFLGLLAAAPVAVPAMVRELASSAAAGTANAADLLAAIRVSAGEWVELRLPSGASRLQGACLRDWSDGRLSYSVEFKGASEVPNRLHGAFIKEDGDAA